MFYEADSGLYLTQYRAYDRMRAGDSRATVKGFRTEITDRPSETERDDFRSTLKAIIASTFIQPPDRAGRARSGSLLVLVVKCTTPRTITAPLLGLNER